MSYKTINLQNQRDLNFVRNALYETTGTNSNGVNSLFSEENIKEMSRKISSSLEGVDPRNRKIIVPDETIINVLNTVYQNFKPNTGDIYGRYNSASLSSDINNDSNNIIYQTIEIIVSDVKSNIGMEEANSSLSVWTTVLGDFNEHGLMQHPKIKLKNRRPTSGLFHMHY
jgi:hypothetical protein